jgi:hypothetical protein
VPAVYQRLALRSSGSFRSAAQPLAMLKQNIHVDEATYRSRGANSVTKPQMVNAADQGVRCKYRDCDGR